jgi:hypothetical protein
MPPSGATMRIPHYVNENKSDMRGIKPGWYAMDDGGKLASGPFASREECLGSGIQPANEANTVAVPSTAEVKQIPPGVDRR